MTFPAPAAANTWFSNARLARYDGGSAMGSHRHDEPSLCLVVAGGYEERIRGRATLHETGHVLFCPAFEAHAQRFTGTGALKILITPTASGVDYLQRHIRVDQAPFAQSVQIAGLAARARVEFALRDDFAPVAIEGLIIETFAQFARAAARHADVAAQWLSDARDFIEARAAQGFRIGELAAAVGHHPVHVCRAFKRAFGMTIAHYARTLRIRRAAQLLRTTGQSVADIALTCGFSDQAHLSRTFKALLGVAPGAYRDGS